MGENDEESGRDGVGTGREEDESWECKMGENDRNWKRNGWEPGEKGWKLGEKQMEVPTVLSYCHYS